MGWEKRSGIVRGRSSLKKLPPEVRMGPPISLFCSTRRTERPREAAAWAAARPAGPPPAIKTSNDSTP